MEENNAVLQNEEQQTSFLEQLEKLQKKQLFYVRVSGIAVVVLVLCFLLMIPSIVKTINLAQQSLIEANNTMVLAQETLTTAKTTLEDVSVLATEGTDGLTNALTKIDEFDIEGLNSAIKDLGAVVEPMAKFFGVFRR